MAMPARSTTKDCPSPIREPNNSPMKWSVGRQISSVSRNSAGTFTTDSTANGSIRLRFSRSVLQIIAANQTSAALGNSIMVPTR